MGSEVTQSMDDKIREALEKHDSLILLLSGGKDSMTVSHHAYSRFRKYVKHCTFINTTISVLATRHFIMEQCKKLNWDLYFLYPKTTFKQYVVDMGNAFPGEGNHKFVMGYLKYTPMRDHILDYFYNKEEHPIYVSGVRKNESQRRSNNYNSPFVKDGNMHFVASAFDLETVDVWDYVKENHLERAPAYEILGYGGDCLCGSYAKTEEIMLLKQFYKMEYDNIKWIESLIPIKLAEIEKEIVEREATASKILSWKAKKERKALQLIYKQRKNLKKFATWGSGPKTEDVDQQMTLTEIWKQAELAEAMTCATDSCPMLLDRE